jgi:hypothetical protein
LSKISGYFLDIFFEDFKSVINSTVGKVKEIDEDEEINKEYSLIHFLSSY